MNDLSQQPRETPFEIEKPRPRKDPSTAEESGHFNPGVLPHYKLRLPKDAEKENPLNSGVTVHKLSFFIF